MRYDRSYKASTKWMAQAACVGADPDVFFPDNHAPRAEIEKAKEVCRRCPVMHQCLNYAVANNESIGIWGGQTEGERKKIRRQQRQRMAQQYIISGVNNFP